MEKGFCLPSSEPWARGRGAALSQLLCSAHSTSCVPALGCHCRVPASPRAQLGCSKSLELLRRCPEPAGKGASPSPVPAHPAGHLLQPLPSSLPFSQKPEPAEAACSTASAKADPVVPPLHGCTPGASRGVPHSRADLPLLVPLFQLSSQHGFVVNPPRGCLISKAGL